MRVVERVFVSTTNGKKWNSVICNQVEFCISNLLKQRRSTGMHAICLTQNDLQTESIKSKNLEKRFGGNNGVGSLFRTNDARILKRLSQKRHPTLSAKQREKRESRGRGFGIVQIVEWEAQSAKGLQRLAAVVFSARVGELSKSESVLLSGQAQALRFSRLWRVWAHDLAIGLDNGF